MECNSMTDVEKEIAAYYEGLGKALVEKYKWYCKALLALVAVLAFVACALVAIGAGVQHNGGTATATGYYDRDAAADRARVAELAADALADDTRANELVSEAAGSYDAAKATINAIRGGGTENEKKP